MSLIKVIGITSTLIAATFVASASAQEQQPPQQPPAAAPAAPAAPPPFATTKVEGTDNVYIFRYGGHQSMFIVTPDGVIATDPIGLRRPREDLYRRDPEGHQQADQVPDLQPPPLRPHRGRQAVQGRGREDSSRTRAPRSGSSSSSIRPRSLPDETVDKASAHHARRHHARAQLCRPEPFRQHAGDAAAEGEDHLHRRHHPGRAVAAAA